jgi:dipeptidyl-peptidase-4
MRFSIRTVLVSMLAFTSSPMLFGVRKPVTLPDLFLNSDRPSPPDPIWRPDGMAFAYKEKDKVWLYNIQTRHADEWIDLKQFETSKHQNEGEASLKPFDWQNRRVHTSGLQWFPDGKSLLVRLANDLLVLKTGQSKPSETHAGIGEHNSPTLSPDGKSVLFRKGFNISVLELNSGHIKQLTSDGSETLLNGQLDWVYPEELNLGTAFWWSPDSQHVAYMQFDVSKELLYPHADLLSLRAVYEPQRYPQAGTPNASVKVGIASINGGPTTWIKLGDTSQYLISRINWSPDSKTIAIQRLTRVQDRLDLLFADTANGELRDVLHETDRSWVNIHDDLAFLDSGRNFLWSSESTGYRHLYVYSSSGKLIRALTSGNWPVGPLAAVDEANQFVYFVAARDHPAEEQLYRVSMDGDAIERLTRESGSHQIAMEPHGRNYLDTWSSLTTPPETTVHSGAGQQLSILLPREPNIESKFEILPEEIIPCSLRDGTTLYARLIRPTHFDPNRKYPVIIFVYGGPQAQAVHNDWSGLSWEQVLAHKGFVIWQLDNRGSAGRGHQFEAPIYHELGKVELADQRAGIQKLISMGFVDKDRIGIYGWSYGGYMTLYSLLRAPDIFKVGVAGAPVTDWHNYDTIYTERYMGLPDANPEGYRRSSNVLAANQLQGKLLIVCNFEDDNVLFQNTMQMMTALHKANKEFDFMLYPQKAHGVSGDMRQGMLEQMTRFFVDNLHPVTQ